MTVHAITACPDDGVLAEWADGSLAADARAVVLAHLDTCAACRRLVAELGASEESEPGASGESLGRGDVIGRLVIERVIGAGAMGVVYAAHDAELGREVAVKLLRPDQRDAMTARASMSREARTLAKLSHPNVITVHDVDVFGEHTVLVMELVDGWTLREWLETARPWILVRDALVQAGRGIAAAHAAKVIHRDVKPDNVLVGRDGRVRVTDFGLARSTVQTAPMAAGSGTATTLAGTPAYMPPELRSGAPLDASTDRYAYCVMLHEAIYGRRPGPGVGKPIAGVPSHVLALVTRGLAEEAADRPASMTAIVDELERRPLITGPRVAVSLLGVGAITATLVAVWPTVAAVEPCTASAAAYGTPWTAPTTERSARALADYQTRWIDLHHQSCMAHHRGEESDQLLDQRIACLRARRDEVAAVSAIVATNPDATEQAVGTLSSLAACGGSAVAQLVPRPEDPVARAAVEGVAAEAAKVRAEIDAANWGACRKLADTALGPARAAGYDPLTGLLLFDRAFCTDEADLARRDLDEALLAAERGRDDLLRVRVLTRLQYLAARRDKDFEVARRWMELGRAVLDRAGGDDELEWIWLINATEVVAANPEEQAGLFDRALLVAARIPGPSWRVATVEGTRGNALADRGLFAEALPHHQKAIAIYEQEYGPNNLRAYDTYCNVVFDLVGMQRFADALPLIPQLDELQNRVDPAGDDSWTRSVEANALRGLGRLDEALAQDRKAVATCEKFQGPDAPSCADAWAGVGMDLLEQGDTSGALAALETAVKLYGESPPREASFALARALPPSQLDRARALAHAAKAKADDLAAHGGTPPERDAIATWLANHPI